MDFSNINNFFYIGWENNFGDSVNKVFFNLLANKNFTYNNGPGFNNGLHYIATGSILNYANEDSIVYGSGFICESSNINIKGSKLNINESPVPKYIISVRGPKTRLKLLKLGIECPENYGDPLLLFPLVYINPNIKMIPKKIGLLPHYIDNDEFTFKELMDSFDTNIYSIENINIKVGINYKKLIDKILECEYIISSSLHGVMMGLIYGRKTIFCQFSKKVVGDLFKFNDFFESLDIEYKVKNIYNMSILENIIEIKKEKLISVAKNMIKIAPFIDNKDELISKCDYIYNFN